MELFVQYLYAELVTHINKIDRKKLIELAPNYFGDLIKAVVDLEKGIMMIDAELHADEEKALLDQGSRQA